MRTALKRNLIILSRSGHKDDGEDEDICVNSSEDEDEEFVYPAAPPSMTDVDTQHISSPRQVHPSPAQLESLYAAASSGDLPLLKRLFKNALESAEIEPFNLANDASSRTGFTALHVAASRGYYDMVVWCK
jgi:ankyrin repeat protein